MRIIESSKAINQESEKVEFNIVIEGENEHELTENEELEMDMFADDFEGNDVTGAESTESSSSSDSDSVPTEENEKEKKNEKENGMLREGRGCWVPHSL